MSHLLRAAKSHEMILWTSMFIVVYLILVNAPPSLQNFLQNLPEKTLILVLYRISNHDNMRAIFHNVAAFASNVIIVDKTSCDLLYRKSIRVSAGAALKVFYTQGPDIRNILVALKDTDFHPYVLSPSASSILKKAKITKRVTLI